MCKPMLRRAAPAMPGACEDLMTDPTLDTDCEGHQHYALVLVASGDQLLPGRALADVTIHACPETAKAQIETALTCTSTIAVAAHGDLIHLN